jgi:hypothetical protein
MPEVNGSFQTERSWYVIETLFPVELIAHMHFADSGFLRRRK